MVVVNHPPDLSVRGRHGHKPIVMWHSETGLCTPGPRPLRPSLAPRPQVLGASGASVRLAGSVSAFPAPAVRACGCFVSPVFVTVHVPPSDTGRVKVRQGAHATCICAWRDRSRLSVQGVRSQLFSCTARAEHQARTYTTGERGNDTPDRGHGQGRGADRDGTNQPAGRSERSERGRIRLGPNPCCVIRGPGLA
jgi:hypothetical protein